MKHTIRSAEDMGHALRQERHSVGVTQNQLSKRIGKVQNAISRIETGDMGRTVNLIFKILSILDLEIEIRPRSKSSAQDIERLFP